MKKRTKGASPKSKRVRPEGKPGEIGSFGVPLPTWKNMGRLPEDALKQARAMAKAKPKKKIQSKPKTSALPPLRKSSQAELMAAEQRLYRGFVDSVTSDTPDYVDFGGNGNGSASKIGHDAFVNENPLQKYDNLVTKVMTLETWCEFLAQKQKIMDQTLAQLIARVGPTLTPQRGIR